MKNVKKVVEKCTFIFFSLIYPCDIMVKNKGVIFMTEEQEYINFWSSIKNKCDEFQKDYNNLSDSNKHRVDNVLRLILRANTISEILNIANNQLR